MKYVSFNDSLETSFDDLRKILYKEFKVKVYTNGYMVYNAVVYDETFKYITTFTVNPNNLMEYEFTYIINIVIALLAFKELCTTDEKMVYQNIDIIKFNKKVKRFNIFLLNKRSYRMTTENINISKIYKETQFIRNVRRYNEKIISILNNKKKSV